MIACWKDGQNEEHSANWPLMTVRKSTSKSSLTMPGLPAVTFVQFVYFGAESSSVSWAHSGCAQCITA